MTFKAIETDLVGELIEVYRSIYRNSQSEAQCMGRGKVRLVTAEPLTVWLEVVDDQPPPRMIWFSGVPLQQGQVIQVSLNEAWIVLIKRSS